MGLLQHKQLGLGPRSLNRNNYWWPTFIFSGLTMQAVGSAAGSMIEEVRNNLNTWFKRRKKGVKPDAARAVAISTAGSLKAMIVPGLIANCLHYNRYITWSSSSRGMLLLDCGRLFTCDFYKHAGGAWDNAKICGIR